MKYTNGKLQSNALLLICFMAIAFLLPGNTSAQSNNNGLQDKTNVMTLVATNKNTGLMDDVIVGLKTDATDQFDEAYDFYKMPNALGRHTLYALSNNFWLMRDYVPLTDEGTDVVLGFEPGVTGKYAFSFEGVNSFDASTIITLEDKKLNKVFNARKGDYIFNSDENDNWYRFVLHFSPSPTISTTDATCAVAGMIQAQQKGAASWNYTIADNRNVPVYNGTLNSAADVADLVTPGVYVLTLTGNEGSVVIKNLVIGGNTPAVAAINTSATTAEQDEQLTFTSATDESFYSWDFGDGTTATGVTTLHSYTGEGVYTVSLTVTNTSGCTAQATKSIDITPRATTGVAEITGNEPIHVWSSAHQVNIDFTHNKAVQAHISIYNLLGQELYSDKFTGNTLFTREVTGIETGYVLVQVRNNEEVTTKKLLLSGTK